MTASITDHRRSLGPAGGITVQPVRLSVSRYASLDEHSSQQSFLGPSDISSPSLGMPDLVPLSISPPPQQPSHPQQQPPPTPPQQQQQSPPAHPIQQQQQQQQQHTTTTYTSTSTSYTNTQSSYQDPSDPRDQASKSTRTTAVIGRLTSSLESARRDLTAERLQHEETLRSLGAVRQRIETVQAENNNLMHARESGDRMLERRDQRITQLKTQLDTEVRRRETAEASAREAATSLDRALQSSKREVAEAKDARGRAEAQYATLRSSFTTHKADLERIKRALREYRANRDEDLTKMVMLEAVCDRQAAEARRADALVKAMTSTVDGYRDQAIVMADTQVGMEKARDQMRWLVDLHGISQASEQTNGQTNGQMSAQAKAHSTTPSQAGIATSGGTGAVHPPRSRRPTTTPQERPTREGGPA